MEFVAGLLCLGVGVLFVVLAARYGRLPADVALWGACGAQALVFATLWFDWGYSWVNETAFSLAAERAALVALPHGVALLIGVALLLWGRRAVPHALALSVLQAGTFELVLWLVSRRTDRSFLAPGPLVALYASTLSTFLFLPAACAVLPRPGSRWHAIAFGPRAGLTDAIRGLADDGFRFDAPRTIFQSGSASGRVGEAEVEVRTEPSMVPFGYALRVRVSPIGPVWPERPGFAPREQFVERRDGIEYVGLSPKGFDVTPERLRAFVRRLAGQGT